MSYGRDEREYGGGGRQGDNYYDSNNNFADRPSGGGYGGGRNEGYGGSEGRNEGYGGVTGGGYGSQDQYGGRPGGGGGYGNYDENEAVSQARRHGDDQDDGMFSQAMSFLGQNKHHLQNEGGVDEQQMVGAHQQLYGSGNQGGGRQHDANSLGSGAAMQALKMFSGGSGGGHGGGNSQSQFIGMAMGQASKLFDQQHAQGNVMGGTDKQSVVNQAAKMALKMYMQSEGKGGGGGPGGLMGLASKFM